ncbi:UDP-N-acetylglucosamine 2-epimerase [Magnetospirillum sp. LM-5]|uniref:UDP-N-acetylglucosamine 2-epimerase n=1 Tax=Magnetospirillum sp. LM-5 TaxID=2681466 RepID=UPI001383D294|nr:UDP-N-acetylglucosamine 2-epimerase [Magnetospirillum sp. LM-5]CAA7622612.1 UDP-N-acetylglucosamine 2-epimerase [Magnetospirillum sp. LM-5]
MTSTRHVAVVTGARADYGLLRPVMDAVRAHPGLDLSVIATGAHLDHRFGHTVDQITADGFSVTSVPMLEPDDSVLAMARAVGRGTIGMAEALAALRPDLVVVLGDRFEILAAAQAALLLAIPLAHLHGGEVTEGAVDESIRHAITKMASLHFAAAEPYARRIRQMGENPAFIFTVGAPGVDSALALDPLPDAVLDQDLGVALRSPTFLVTYHPVTRRDGDEGAAIDHLLAALDGFPQARIVITGVNADAGHQVVSRRLAAFAAARPERVSLHDTLGQRRYLSVMRRASLVIGNSSSGLIEAPALKVPTIDIGDRQAGRLRAQSVIHCDDLDATAIAAAIEQGLSPAFRATLDAMQPPYGGGDVGRTVADILAGIDIAQLRRKPFFDLPETSSWP